ncbi:hypothetical protein CEXT_616361 [Caerostris extrusa]|uniref:Uncharacterized protein n=1 Tax=Caerostris extrusa TaxID=172846 RepID=A0AAV4W7Y6_CAEEX|nr:hypothetical protein CEXT_616361 [Caerostris extrusa]
MGYPTARSSFCVEAVRYVRFSEPGPNYTVMESVFSPTKVEKTTVLFFLVNPSETDGINSTQVETTQPTLLLYSIKPSASHYGVSNRKLFPSRLWLCITCDSLNPTPNPTVMEKCFLSNQNGSKVNDSVDTRGV